MKIKTGNSQNIFATVSTPTIYTVDAVFLLLRGHVFHSNSHVIPYQVFTWVADVGNRFLSLNTSIGSDSRSGQRLLKSHDTFDSETEVRTYLGVGLLGGGHSCTLVCVSVAVAASSCCRSSEQLLP